VQAECVELHNVVGTARAEGLPQLQEEAKSKLEARAPRSNGPIQRCPFDKPEVPRHSCAKYWQQLHDALVKLGAPYFLRSGTELGAVRQGNFIGDGAEIDLDIYVDYPTLQLLDFLKKQPLSPPPVRSDDEVHWKPGHGCAYATLVFNDWADSQMDLTTGHNELCLCNFGGASMYCAVNGVERMDAMT